MNYETAESFDAQQACDVLLEAAELIREDPNRRASLLRFDGAGQLVVTGDMHGNLRNFAKLQRYCRLDSSPGRYVLLHELIHQETAGFEDYDTSIDLLVRAAAWKVAHPDNVFFIQSNHELAQLIGQEITKAGRSVIHDFERGVAHRFGPSAADRVMLAVEEYLKSLPLAAQTANGVFIAHSLPDPAVIPAYDYGLFEREPLREELMPGGLAYSLVWGRYHSPEIAALFAEKVGADVLVIGHTPQESGFRQIGEHLLIIASDHNHGVFLPIDLSQRYTMDELVDRLRKFVSVE